MNAFIRKTTITARLLAMTLAAVTLASCSSDDKETAREELTQNGITLTASTVSSLSFEWEAVANASQYGYRLLNGDGEALEGGVTTDRAVSFTGLTDDTEYTFEVTSFATYDSQYKNGEAKTISVRTDKIVPLAAPVLASEVKNEKISVSWDAVENADKYYVKVTDSEGTERNDTIADTSYSLTGTVGLTYSVSVSADTEAEAYSQSEWATAENLVPEKTPRTEIWRVTGTMDDQAIYKTQYTRTMIAYDDGTYIIQDYLYGGSGCDLQFKVDSYNMLDIQNGTYDSATGYYAVEYYPGYNAYIYPWYYNYYYSYFDRDKGSLYFYAKDDYSNDGYCTFTWNPDDVKVSWVVKGKMLDSTIYGTSVSKNESEHTLIAYKDGSYKIPDWLGNEGYDLNFTPQDNGTLKLEGDNYADYGYCVSVPFYSDAQYGLYNVYLYNATMGSDWGLETDTDECEFWILAYYSDYGYFQFKWNKADVINY